MKSIKVFYHGKRLKDIYPYATRWQLVKYRVRMFIRRLVITTMSLAMLYALIYVSFLVGINSIKADVKPVVEKSIPVLDRILKCESENNHYKNGQVKINVNTNGSVDIGKYQINLRSWGAKATSMGLDLTNEKDNETMAIWIYNNRGTEDWYSSKSCWSK